MDVNQEIVRYVESTGKVLKQAEQLTEQLAREEAKIAESAPKVANSVSNQRPHSQDRARDCYQEAGLSRGRLGSSSESH
jgi:hypothetical protein